VSQRVPGWHGTRLVSTQVSISSASKRSGWPHLMKGMRRSTGRRRGVIPVVIDASAGIELAADTVQGRALRALLPADAVPWVPEHFYVECGAVLRVTQVRRLFADAWRLRANVTFADARHVALAEHLGADLLSDDGRLANTPRLPVRVLRLAWRRVGSDGLVDSRLAGEATHDPPGGVPVEALAVRPRKSGPSTRSLLARSMARAVRGGGSLEEAFLLRVPVEAGHSALGCDTDAVLSDLIERAEAFYNERGATAMIQVRPRRKPRSTDERVI
jgi:predicted nucleic acid-binding protein